MMPWVRPVLVAGLVFGLAVVCVRLLPEEAFIFYPSRGVPTTPASAGLAFDPLEVRTADGETVRGWLIPGLSGADTTVIVFNGNAGNIAFRIDRAARIRQATGASVVLFDYRGYGDSTGRPSEQGLYADARAVLAEVRTQRPADRIVYFGESLGTAVATQLATEQPPAALILEAPFESIPRMAGRLFPFVPGGMIRNRFDTASKIGRVQAPVLVLHSDRDEVVPFEQGEEVFRLANEPKQFFRVRGGGHNTTYLQGGQAYWNTVASFVRPRS